MNDLHLQVGQLMIMGFEGPTISRNVETLLDTIQPAGVVLFSRNIDDAAQVHRLLGDCQDLVETALGPLASPETRQTVARAETRPQAIALLLMSAEFQRR